MDGSELAATLPVDANQTDCFDYGCLRPELANRLRTLENRIIHRLKHQVREIAEIGRDLLEVKDQLDYGLFGAWLKTAFAMSDRTAATYMRVAEVLGDKIETVSNLPLRVVYMLVARQTPEAMRLEIMRQIEAGKSVTEESIRRLICDRRRPARAKVMPRDPDQINEGVEDAERIAPTETAPCRVPAHDVLASLWEGLVHVPHRGSGESVEHVLTQAISFPGEAALAEPDKVSENSEVRLWAKFTDTLATLCCGMDQRGVQNLQNILKPCVERYCAGYLQGKADHDVSKRAERPPKGRGSFYPDGWLAGWLAAKEEAQRAPRPMPLVTINVDIDEETAAPIELATI